MKRRDLMKQLADYAKTNGLDITTVEGASHTKVKIGDKQTTVPRHSEVNDLTAKAILKQIGVTK
jgi:mRNA interferase HicA